jgi:hypothetical protein
VSGVEVDAGDHQGPDCSDHRLHDDVTDDVDDGDGEGDVHFGVGAERQAAETRRGRRQRRGVLNGFGDNN